MNKDNQPEEILNDLQTNSINWKSKGEYASPCPVCKHENREYIASFVADRCKPSLLVRCAQCESIYPTIDNIMGYIDNYTDDWLAYKFYVEAGVGIVPMLMPLLYIPDLTAKSLLDIGCGAGFVPFFWKNALDARAIGIEKSAYGAYGREALDVDIRDIYLDADSRQELGTFDILYASHVVEHISDIRSFLLTVKSMLNEGGLFCFTTPSAEYIQEHNDKNWMLQLLSPTQHYFLFSKKALTALLQEAGFTHQEIFVSSGGEILAYASMSPLPKLEYSDTNKHLLNVTLNTLTAINNNFIAGGLLYRQIAEFRQDGRNGEALNSKILLLRKCVLEQYGFDLYESLPFYKSIKDEPEDSFFNKVPFYWGDFLFFMAKEHIKNRDYKKALELLPCAIDVLKRTNCYYYRSEASHLIEYGESSQKVLSLLIKNREQQETFSSSPKQKKIALISASSLTTSLDGAADSTLPYTLAITSAWIKQEHPNYEVFLANSVKEALESDEVWCSSLSEFWNETIELGRICTEAGKALVVGGHHATALPETMPYGKVLRGPLETCSDINELPMPDWSIFTDADMEKRSGLLMTSSGYPLKCSFCSPQSFGGEVSIKSPERVLAEILQLTELGVSNVVIFDDLFAFNPTRLKSIADIICSYGLNSLTYSCLIRSDTINNEVLTSLRKMNVKDIAFGSESGSNVILKAMNKGTTVEKNIKAFKLLKAFGFKPNTSLVIGYPGETAETLKATVKYIETIRPMAGTIDIYPLIPYPGTPIWKHFMDMYKPDLQHFDWSSLALRSNAVDWEKYKILTDGCTKNDLRGICNWNAKYST